MKLIDKDKVVAEIRNKVDSYKGDGIISIGVLKQHCEDFINYLDTLEVKEVDLEVEDDFIEKAIGWIDYNNRSGGCFFYGWEKDFRKYMKEE